MWAKLSLGHTECYGRLNTFSLNLVMDKIEFGPPGMAWETKIIKSCTSDACKIKLKTPRKVSERKYIQS